MKYLTVIILFSILLSIPFQARADQYYVSPGKGVENLIYLGTDMGKMFDHWGSSDNIQEGYGVLIYDYKKYQLGFATEIYTNKVVIIFIYTYLYKTPNNLGVGSSMEDVIKVYGSNYRVQKETSMGGNAIFYDSRGIGFGVNNNKVVSIAIFYPQ